MSSPRSAGTVMQSMVEMFHTGEVADVASVVATEYVDHQGLGSGELVGIEGFCLVVRTARSAYDTLDVFIEDLTVEGDRATARISWHGTRPAGEEVTRETIDTVRVEAGRAVEHWGRRVAAG